MDADRAIAIIERILAPKALNYVQIAIVRGVILGSSYQNIVSSTTVDGWEPILAQKSGSIDPSASAQMELLPTERYKLNYLKDTAAQLWQTIGHKLGKKVTKKSLAAVLLWYTKQSGPEFSDIQDLTPVELPAIDPLPQPAANPPRDGSFYGRKTEIAILTDWCLVTRCRLILLVAMGGMGKTTLAGEVFNRLGGNFDRMLWRSLVDVPTPSEFCTDLIRWLQPQLIHIPSTVEGQIDLLIACLQQERCLLAIDNVESVLAGQVQCGQYLPGYGDYDRLFKAIGELPHQSCAMLTSREKPQTIARSQIVNPQLVRVLNINGMNLIDAEQLVRAYGCPNLPAQMWQEVHAHYTGNPLALKIATIAAVEMTGGGDKMLELYPLMKQGKIQFQNIDDSLGRQFDRLSAIEQQLVYWLAIVRTPITGFKLRAKLILNPHAPGEIINALQSLSRRCIAICQDAPGQAHAAGKQQLPQRQWSIQPVTMAYVTSRLIDRFVAELSPNLLTNIPLADLSQHFFYLNTYAIVEPKTTDRSSQIQRQSILDPTLDRLLTIWKNRTDLNRHLHEISIVWQSIDPRPAGYFLDNISSLINN
jgi:hypothetical protein